LGGAGRKGAIVVRGKKHKGGGGYNRRKNLHGAKRGKGTTLGKGGLHRELGVGAEEQARKEKKKKYKKEKSAERQQRREGSLAQSGGKIVVREALAAARTKKGRILGMRTSIKRKEGMLWKVDHS